MNDFIVDNNTYILAKDSNKNDVDNKTIQDIIFLIFLEIDRICRKNNIPYALSFGSALGLYNYGGFIPWDDDGDIAINYDDYDKFVDALKSDLGDDFTFECFEVDNRVPIIIPPIKVRYKHSNIVEKNHITIPNRTNRGNGIFVDICPFMGVPSDIKEHKKLIFKTKIRMPWLVLLEGIAKLNCLKTKSRLKKFEKEMANQYHDSDYVSQSILIPFQEYPRKIVEHLSFPRDVIYPFKEYDFNGHKLYSFNNIEEFCRLRYGQKALKIKTENGYAAPFRYNGSSHLIKVDIYKKEGK